VTELEAKAFMNDLLISFPAFDDAARNSPDLASTHRSWATAWRDLSLDECQAALGNLQRQGGIGWDDYRAPGPFIRRLVLSARKNQPLSEDELVRKKEQRGELERNRRQYRGSPMAQALTEARELHNAGASKEIIYAAIDRVLAGDGA